MEGEDIGWLKHPANGCVYTLCNYAGFSGGKTELFEGWNRRVAASQGGWRPIAEAKRDRSVIIGWEKTWYRPDLVRFEPDDNRWHNPGRVLPIEIRFEPTHFIPMPDPPKEMP